MANVNNRTQFIRDRIMFHITDSADKTKFGMSTMVGIFGGNASEEEVSEAIAWLLSNEYLKKLGKHVFGVGTYEGVKRYDLSDHDPESLIPDVDLQDQPSLDKQPPVTDEKATESLVQCEQERQERLQIENIPTLFGIKQQAREEVGANNVFDAIEMLKQQLKPKPVPNAALKMAVLSELASALDPDISIVLREIQADYKNHVIN